MPDEVDLGQRQEELHRQTALDSFRRRPKPSGTSPTHCVACRAEIEAARRLAVPGTNLCAECARDLSR